MDFWVKMLAVVVPFLLLLPQAFVVRRNAGQEVKTDNDSRTARVMVLLTIILVAVLMLFVHPFSSLAVSVPTVLVWIGVTLCGVGCSLNIWSLNHLGENYSMEVRIRDGHTLTTTGPYRYVRHPIYTAIYMVGCGVSLMTGHLAVVTGSFLYCAILHFKAQKEEEELFREVGEEFVMWKRDTWRIVSPWV